MHCIQDPSAFSRRAVVSYWRKYVHKVLVNRLGGLSLPRKSVVRLTDRPDMTLDVYRGRKTTMQQLYSGICRCLSKGLFRSDRCTCKVASKLNIFFACLVQLEITKNKY